MTPRIRSAFPHRAIPALVALLLQMASVPAAKGSPLPRGYVVQDLGTLGGRTSSALGINEAGQVVGESAVSVGGPSLAFFYDGSRMRALNSGTDTGSRARGINDTGQVVGELTQRGGTPLYYGFLYDGVGMRDLASADGSGISAASINNHGTIAGGAFVSGNWDHAFLHDGATFTDLSPWVGRRSGALDINSSGLVVGFVWDAQFQNMSAFVYDGSTARFPGTLGGPSSIAYAVSDRGHVAGAASVGPGRDPMHAFLYDGSTMQDLGTLGGSNSFAHDINSSGVVVGESQFDRSGAFHAFVYSGGVMKNLNQLIPPGSGWVMKTARGVNDAGQIVGTGILGGDERAFLLTPLPPDTLAPTTHASLSPPVGDGGWHNSAVTLTLDAADESGGSGVASITYGATGAQPIAEKTVEGNRAVAVLNTEGESTIRFSAMDVSGNRETPGTLTLRLDATPPATAMENAPLPDGGVKKANPRLITLRATDATSGVSSITYQASGAHPIPATTVSANAVGIPLTLEGTTTIVYSARDAAGNEEAPRSITILVGRDRTPPVTTATISPPPNANGVNVGTVTVTISAIDDEGGSGVDSITYSARGAHPIPRTSVSGSTGPITVTITTQGVTTVYFVARDRVGNVESLKTLPLRIGPADATAPPLGNGEPLPVTYENLCELVRQLVTDASLAETLCGRLNAAQIAGSKRQKARKARALADFARILKKRQRPGGPVTATRSDLLRRLSRGL
jgi:probable HAF family extracellular repeat protein